MSIGKDLFAAVARALLRLRYRIRIEGIEKLQGVKQALIFPNHPAQIDPLIITSCFWPYLEPSPVVSEKYYYLPGAGHFMRLLKAIPMPDMDVDGGRYKRKRVERANQASAELLRTGGSLLLYPSGRLMPRGLEQLGGNSGAQALLQAVPEATVVLVRVRGLFGSIFSKACTGGQSPDFWHTAAQALGILLRNFVFFAPRREVSLTLEVLPAAKLRTLEVRELNRFLESFYNQLGEEPATFVSQTFWKETLPELPKKPEQLDLAALDVSPLVAEKVRDRLAAFTGGRAENIRTDQRLGADLGIDSLNIAELVAWLDEEFDVTDVELPELNTVADLMQIASGQRRSMHTADVKAVNGWEEAPGARLRPELPQVETIQGAFLRTAKRMNTAVAAADDRSGILSWRRFLIGALVLAEEFRQLPGKRLGILLPASAGVTLSILAALLARKTPVLLNWTAGERNLEHAVRLAEVEAVITAEGFLDRVEVDLDFLFKRFVLLEQLKRSVTLVKKLRALWLSRKNIQALERHFEIDTISGSDTAVILFTSGSEAAPKGVPLSHKNILSNIAAAMDVFEFLDTDVIYGFLPPFHSFGLTATTLLPVTSGLKVVYHPNPNESRKLALGCKRWGVTLVAGTPTFLRRVLQAGGEGSFDKLRYLISGAEKAPEELFALTQKLAPRALVLEGYGITECSPMATANRPNKQRAGVGYPLLEAGILIVDLEKKTPLPDGERGLILISGPGVFSGYLGGKPDPFLQVEGRRWYNSGDLGFLKDGALHLAGRLKRFVKVGGEMVSLPAIEDVLRTSWPDSEDGPVVAVSAREFTDGSRPEIVLLAAVPVGGLEKINEVLRAAGLSNLARVSRIKVIDAIPLLGNCKVDYQTLNTLIN